MVKKYTPEIYTPSDVTAFKPVESGDVAKSFEKWANSAFEGDLAAAVIAAQWAANQAKNHKNEAGKYASAAKNSERISWVNKDETSVLKDTTEVASKNVKEAEKKSKEILKKNTQKEKQVAENLDAVWNLAKEVFLKDKKTSDTLKWAEEAKAAAENAAKQAIAAARAMGEPQQKQMV